MSSNSILHLWLLAAGAAAVAAWALYKFVASVRRDRLLADVPQVRIRSAAQGYVRVHGHTRPAAESPTAAPLSRRPCVWWSYEICEKQRNSKGETEWRTIDSASCAEPFVLADDDCECLVGPVHAEITPTSRDVWYGEEVRPSSLSPVRQGLLASGSHRYTERLLGVGAELSVIGDLRSHSEIDSASAAAATLLRQWKQDQRTLLERFDANHDGHIDASEWEAARAAAAAEAEASALKAPVSRVSVIGEPLNGEPFLIAPLDGQALVRREKRRAIFYFVFGLAAVIVCAWAVEHARALTSAALLGS